MSLLGQSLGEVLRRLIHKMDPTYDTSNLVTANELLEGVVDCYEPIDPSIYKVKGSITNAGLQALTDQEVGDVWNISDSGTFPIGSNVVWTGQIWDKLSETLDLSAYVTTSAMETALSAKQDTLTAGTNITIESNVISATGGEKWKIYNESTDWSSFKGNGGRMLQDAIIVGDINGVPFSFFIPKNTFPSKIVFLHSSAYVSGICPNGTMNYSDVFSNAETCSFKLSGIKVSSSSGVISIDYGTSEYTGTIKKVLSDEAPETSFNRMWLMVRE